MKRPYLLIALFTASCAMAFGADDAVGVIAPAPSMWQTFLADVLYPGLLSLIALAVAKIGNKVSEYFRKQIAGLRHGQVIGIIYDAAEMAVAKKAKLKGVRYQDMVKDLKIDSAEWAEISADAAEIAESILADVRGYAKDKGGRFIAERIDLALGELQSRLIAFKEASAEVAVSESEAVES